MWNFKALKNYIAILSFKSLKTKRVNNLCSIGSSFFFLTRLSHTPTVESSCPVTKNFSSKSTAATKSPCALLWITKYLYYLTKYLTVNKPLNSLKTKTKIFLIKGHTCNKNDKLKPSVSFLSAVIWNTPTAPSRPAVAKVYTSLGSTSSNPIVVSRFGFMVMSQTESVCNVTLWISAQFERYHTFAVQS